MDMTTSEPSLAQEIYAAAKEKGVCTLDAPGNTFICLFYYLVSGGDIGARDAKLSIMVGGDKNTFEDVTPLFQVFS